MSYQVLARKWRPHSFPEMVGQTHVQRVLINALDSQRLHHAYLFTGTRGVGKTTIARIFAKSLNCETNGVSANPCGKCNACQEVDSGRFVDLIEVDAASRTKVEDTRELLENVQFSPTRGRYKVYLIDEVHMLSTSSFNALLKTLEEPPDHVKFLFATTDPQKLPATILSRCLQFSLKRLSPEQISGHLAHILKQESIEHEAAGLRLLAKAADGSMRDALSLLDQAIAFGGGQLNTDDVSAMLGTIDRGTVVELLEALAAQDAKALLAHTAHMAANNPDFAQVLAEFAALLQKIALVQTVPDTAESFPEEADSLTALAAKLTPEDVQLYYQIALLGRRDLPLAPDLRGGFEMVMLRMLAFRPLNGEWLAPASPPPAAASSASATPMPPSHTTSPPPASASRNQNLSSVRELLGQTDGKKKTKDLARQTPKPQTPRPSPAPSPASSINTVQAVVPQASTPAASTPQASSAIPPAAQAWYETFQNLKLSGSNREVALHSYAQQWDAQQVELWLSPSPLLNQARLDALQSALALHLGQTVQIKLEQHSLTPEQKCFTPQAILQQQQQQAHQVAQALLENDPFIQALQSTFNARLLPDTIRHNAKN